MTEVLFQNLIRVAERFFSGIPQSPPPWRLLPESLFLSSLASKTQMPKGQQPVVGVLTVQHVVPPMPVESAFVRPQGVDKIQGTFLDGREVLLQSGKCVQRSGG